MTISIPVVLLREGSGSVGDVLRDYFGFSLLPLWRINDDVAEVHLIPPPSEFYVDPRLAEGLNWWSPILRVRDIPVARRRVAGCLVSLNDAWTLWSWSEWLQRRKKTGCAATEVVILHADDHDDLMSPLLVQAQGVILDAVTRREVLLEDPRSVVSAIKSGAVGIGSFIVPLLFQIPTVHIRHLRVSGPCFDPVPLSQSYQPDTLLMPGMPRLEAAYGADCKGPGSYLRTSRLEDWVADLDDRPILLHIDLDYFNNRFDGDSDWQSRQDRHDPDRAEVTRMVGALFDALDGAGVMGRIEDVTISLSPGFFPAEFWAPMTQHIIERLRPHIAGWDTGNGDQTGW